MFGARHAIIITFKSIPSDVDAVFEDFKSILNEFDPNKHLDLYWEKNSIVTESVSMIKERLSIVFLPLKVCLRLLSDLIPDCLFCFLELVCFIL